MAIEINQVMEQIAALDGVLLPVNKTERRLLGFHLKNATPGQPVNIFVGSCPDYSHRDGLYTHESLGEGVPLLTGYHLKFEAKLLEILDSQGIPYIYTIMVADVEAVDDIFCKMFTEGDEAEFLRRCQYSVHATADHLAQGLPEAKGRMVSSSFFQVFGRERFLHYQHAYQEVLATLYEQDDSFSQRVNVDTIKRMGMYENMYKGVFRGNDFSEQLRFCNIRTMRTMAQYLTLGRLMSEQGPHPVIINHPTRNIGVFNDRNKFLLPEDTTRPQPTIPVLQIKQEVYK